MIRRGADIANVEFSHCIIDELDVSDEKVKRERFVECYPTPSHSARQRATTATCGRKDLGSLRGVRSLKGAIIDKYQLQLFEPDFVRLVGGRVR